MGYARELFYFLTFSLFSKESWSKGVFYYFNFSSSFHFFSMEFYLPPKGGFEGAFSFSPF